MRKEASITEDHDSPRLRPEYDFSSGVRGKHAQALATGYTITIHQPDGATVVETITPPAGLVVLAPDVHAYFPDSEAVNRALRGLIELIPASSARSAPRSRRAKRVTT